MNAALFDDPALVFTLAMTAGVVAQAVARHLAVPGIVLLLAGGVLLGPDVANLIRPQALGPALPVIVGLAVAVILFEGGMSLKVSALRAQAVPIRRLVTWGAILTGAGGGAAAWLIMGWDIRLSILFGTLVIVTGPTVITPLLRRMRVEKRVSTILEAEGIFIDAVGATIAIVALEVAIAPSRAASGLFGIFPRLGVGIAVGAIIGLPLAYALRSRRLIPAGLENITSLALAVLSFAASNAIVHESGIAAAIVAGLIVGNVRSHASEHVAEFNEQLTSLWIATLFVLLAADVRVADVVVLGWPGVITVVILMVVVRPLVVFATQHHTELQLREKLFLSWLAPRGIVAAAVASLFAIELGRAGIAGGDSLRALVFLVIAMTVTIQGLSGGLVARILRLRLPARSGILMLGADPLAVTVAELLQNGGQRVTLLDSNRDVCETARASGLDVVCGNGLDPAALAVLATENREVCASLTANESTNFMFIRTARERFRVPELLVALDSHAGGLQGGAVHDQSGHVLFGGEFSLHDWQALAQEGMVRYESWIVTTEHDGSAQVVEPLRAHEVLLPLVVWRKKRARLYHDDLTLLEGDCLVVAVRSSHLGEGHEKLRQAGCRPARADEVLAPSMAPPLADQLAVAAKTTNQAG